MMDWRQAVDLTAKDHGYGTPIWVLALVISATLASSFGLALAGEPSSVWLWRDVLKML